MKNVTHIVEKLNDLLILSEEVENTYVKVSEKLKFTDNIAYSKKIGAERGKFVQFLKKELDKIDKGGETTLALKRRNHLIRTNYKKYFKIGNDLDFLEKVYEMEVLSVNKYDDLLSQINLPLTLCRMLLKQRDSIQARLHVIERGEPIMASSY
ncbi:ferritin family protein [Seonamhaeicola marinus]|uniref:DUF2383 domain-containing protein n=1 Tax=Seonamhaeicola marinus TaxID=1912246 RepID=A0A5D0HFC9_9FLAO|nr:hypothetical protein [Seonamhaeicola marinus]TYA70006.1 hypothetical protein FUA24_22215 [Seonamhaeicola marinus]